MFALLISLLIATIFAETCINKGNIEWQSYGNQLYLNNERFNLKGLNWFGFETGRGNFDGLNVHNRDWYFQWIIDNDFNAIRMPFAADFLNNKNGWNDYIEAVMAAGEYGIFVMLDMHSVGEGEWREGFLDLDQDVQVETWRTLAQRLVAAGAWNVMFVDVFNEPHDVTNDLWGAWLDYCERVAEAVWDAGLNALIAVEGTNWNCGTSPVNCAWGENLIGVREKGLTFSASQQHKFVYSPHVYGADVTNNYNYNEASWETHWAYLATQSQYNNEAAIVIGEFGTKYDNDFVRTWLDTLVDYLVSIDQRNHFYWCLNPNSGDTGGLLQDDWTTPQDGKLAALYKLQPSPSKVSVSTNRICVTGLGEPADAPPASAPVSSPTTPPPASSSGTIKILQNANSNNYWFAIEFPNNDNGAITKLEMRDSNHGSWFAGTYETWGTGAYSFNDGTQFNGNMHFRVTTSAGTQQTWNVFSGIIGGATAYINIKNPGSFTEEESGTSSSQIAGIVAGIICALLCVLCIGGGIWWYKKHSRLNKGEATFKATDADTPEPSNKADTPVSDEMQQQDTSKDAEDAEAEIEIEMDVETTTQ